MSSFYTVCLFSLLARSSLGATLTDSQTMRRETIGADSQMVRSEIKTQLARLAREIDNDGAIKIEIGARASLTPMDKPKAKEDAFCDIDFPLGTESTKDSCKIPAQHHSEVSSSQCIKAAEMAGAKMESNYNVEQKDYGKHPKGCFLDACKEAEHTGKQCYLYNGAESAQIGSTIKGTPVCWRDRYKNGTDFVGALLEAGATTAAPAEEEAATTAAPAADTAADATVAAAGEGGCMEGYEVIMDADACSKAASCLDYCESQWSRIGIHNGTRHTLFPLGCFINTKEDGCVYYNEPSAMGKPPKPHGTNICKVSKTTTLNAA